MVEEIKRVEDNTTTQPQIIDTSTDTAAVPTT